MPKQVTVTLGGREYVLQEKHAGPHRVWRDRIDNSNVMKIFKSLDGAMGQLVEAGDAIQEAWVKATSGKEDEEGKGDLPLNKLIDVIRILPIVVLGVSGSMNEIHELLFAYDGKLAAQRKWIEEHAYDSEITAAFMDILGLAYPIMGLWGLVAGRRAPSTESSLPSTNGASGLPASGPKKKTPISS